jgi:hypothetical protein
MPLPLHELGMHHMMEQDFRRGGFHQQASIMSGLSTGMPPFNNCHTPLYHPASRIPMALDFLRHSTITDDMGGGGIYLSLGSG